MVVGIAGVGGIGSDVAAMSTDAGAGNRFADKVALVAAEMSRNVLKIVYAPERG